MQTNLSDFTISKKVAMLIGYHGACHFIFSKNLNEKNDLYMEFLYEDVSYPLKLNKNNVIQTLDEYEK